MWLYLEVTQDEYELPVRVADSVGELARKTGLKPASISSEISHRLSGRRPKSRFIRVEVED